MQHIIYMTILGIIAGAIAGFWTRIIRRNMIFSFVYEWLEKYDQAHIIKTGTGYGTPLSKFIRCIFCIPPWLVFALEAFYICTFHPWWLYSVIGVLGGLGAGNMVAEIIHCLRNER